MANNIFLGGSPDPLLGGQGYQVPNIDDKMSQLKDAYDQLAIQRQNVMQQQQSVGRPQQSQSPTWDEIDKITTDMTDREFEIMSGNEEFQQSQQRIMEIFQREQMRIMRPIIEASKDGKDALEKHFTLVKRLKKSAAEEANRNLELFNEYTEKYPDMPYAEFLKMKKGGGKKK